MDTFFGTPCTSKILGSIVCVTCYSVEFNIDIFHSHIYGCRVINNNVSKMVSKSGGEKMAKNNQKDQIWAIFAQFGQNGNFPPKSGSVTFLPLWTSNFMQSFRKKYQMVHQ